MSAECLRCASAASAASFLQSCFPACYFLHLIMQLMLLIMMSCMGQTERTAPSQTPPLTFCLFSMTASQVPEQLVSPESVPLVKEWPTKNSSQPSPDTLKSSSGSDRRPFSAAAPEAWNERATSSHLKFIKATVPSLASIT